MLYEYVSKKLSDGKNNITVAHEEGVELHYGKFHKDNYQGLEASLTRVSKKARSKYCFLYFYFGH